MFGDKKQLGVIFSSLFYHYIKIKCINLFVRYSNKCFFVNLQKPVFIQYYDVLFNNCFPSQSFYLVT